MLLGNRLPLAVIELKNAAGEAATMRMAFQEFRTCQAEVPSPFAANALLICPDGAEAQVEAIGAGREWFKPRRIIAGETLAGNMPGRAARKSHRRAGPGRGNPFSQDDARQPSAQWCRVAARLRPAAPPWAATCGVVLAAERVVPRLQ